MIIKEVIENLHNNNLTSNQMNALIEELQKNTLLRYLGEFNLLPETFKKQLNLYLKDQKQFDHNHTTDVHDAIFLNKRESIIAELEKTFETNLRTKTDIIEAVKAFANDDKMIEYLSFVNDNLVGGDTEHQIKLSLQYYLEKTETPEDVLKPLEDGMTAVARGEVYLNKTYSCMPGLADRLIDRVGALMDCQEDVRDDFVYRDYAQSVLLDHLSGEGKLALMSALWYALGLPELAWVTAPTTKQQLYFNDQSICNLDEHGKQSAHDALFSYFESKLIETDKWVKRNRSRLDELTKGQAFNDDEMIDKVSELEQDYKDYLRKNVETFFERHLEPVDTVARTFNEGSYFGYKDIHVDETILKDGDIDEVLSIAQQNFEAHGEEHLLIEMCKTLKLDIGQLRCILLGIVDGIDGLFEEMCQIQSSEKSDKIISKDVLGNRAQTQYSERLVKSVNVYRYWREKDNESRLYLYETLLNKDDLLTKLLYISEDHWLSYIRSIESIYAREFLIINSMILGFNTVFKQLLDHMIGVNTPFYFGTATTNMLALASAWGRIEIVKMLLMRRGINVNNVDSEGATPLTIAVYKGHKEIVKMLLKRADIEVNNADRNGFTPLISAARYGHKDVVSMLLERADIEVNNADRDGFTPLISAARHGHKDVVSMLLERADIEVKAKSSWFFSWFGRYGRTALIDAAIFGHKEIVEMLCDHKDIEVNANSSWNFNHGITALITAARYGHKDVVSILLKKSDIEVNKQTGWYGDTALVHAALHGHKETVRMLCDHKDIEVNMKTGWSDQTALMFAACHGHKETVRILCDHTDIEVNAKTSWHGITSLMFAASHGHKEIVSMLLERADIEVNKRNNLGGTALRAAVFYGQSDMVETLLNDPRVECHILDIGFALIKCNQSTISKLYKHHWLSQKIESAVSFSKSGFEYIIKSIDSLYEWLIKKVKQMFNERFNQDPPDVPDSASSYCFKSERKHYRYQEKDVEEGAKFTTVNDHKKDH